MDLGKNLGPVGVGPPHGHVGEHRFHVGGEGRRDCPWPPSLPDHRVAEVGVLTDGHNQRRLGGGARSQPVSGVGLRGGKKPWGTGSRIKQGQHLLDVVSVGIPLGAVGDRSGRSHIGHHLQQHGDAHLVDRRDVDRVETDAIIAGARAPRIGHLRLIPDHPAPVPGTITRLSGIRVVGRVAVSVGGESEDH